jgi:hypothetical protein
MDSGFNAFPVGLDNLRSVERTRQGLNEPPAWQPATQPHSKRGIKVRYSILGLAMLQMLAQFKSGLLRVRKLHVN